MSYPTSTPNHELRYSENGIYCYPFGKDPSKFGEFITQGCFFLVLDEKKLHLDSSLTYILLADGRIMWSYGVRGRSKVL